MVAPLDGRLKDGGAVGDSDNGAIVGDNKEGWHLADGRILKLAWCHTADHMLGVGVSNVQ